MPSLDLASIVVTSSASDGNTNYTKTDDRDFVGMDQSSDMVD